MSIRPAAALRALLARRAAATRDPVAVAREVVATGCSVALQSADDVLVERLRAAGLAGACELAIEVDRLGPGTARRRGSLASAAGLSVVLSGPAAAVDAVGLPGAGVVVPAREPGAEDRCRALAGGPVRLVAGHGHTADLAFVRCLNVLMAGEGHPGVAVSDPRLIAIADERAAWNGRPPDSWELVMPYGVLPLEQRRLVAAGRRVRVVVPPGGRS